MSDTNGYIRHRFISKEKGKTGPFTVGDRVMISTTSMYYNSTDNSNPRCGGVIGSIPDREVMSGSDYHGWDVKWDNDKDNIYRQEDLVHEIV